MGKATAHLIAETAARNGVKLTAHAPYFINFNSREIEKVKASQGRLLQTARIAALCGADSVVFHAAFHMGDPPEKTYLAVKHYLEEVLNQLKSENNPVCIRPELMGKPSQFGTLDEILSLCAELEGVAPCIDFSHGHARSGKDNSYPEFAAVLRRIEERLGRTALDNMHIHVSGIHYGHRGELKHLNLDESDFQYTELIKALIDHRVSGVVICESPNLEEDARRLQSTYNSFAD